MAFFKNSKTNQLYFSPIFSRQGDSNCSGKLCIVPPLAQKLSFLLPLFALIILSLTSIKAASIFMSGSFLNFADLEDINIWVMSISLIPGGCTTAIAIQCQLRSVKSGLYYENSQGSIELDQSRSLSIYATYALMLMNIALGYIWFHKNPCYDFEEMPFFPLIIILIGLVSLPMWSRLFWLIRKWSHREIVWTNTSHF